MANILVSKMYTVSDHATGWPHDRSSETDLENTYTEMLELMTASATQHLTDLDDVIIHHGVVNSIREAFQQDYYKIRDLVQAGHNVLYCDADVLFLRPTDVFGVYQDFSMWNYTDPSSTTEPAWALTFPDYFNCGIRYYPAGMSADTWQIGDARFALLHTLDRWDAEQLAYNEMLWSQAGSVTDRWQPRMAYQFFQSPTASLIINRIPWAPENNCLDIPNIIHCHGSRGAKALLQRMQRIRNFTYLEN